MRNVVVGTKDSAFNLTLDTTPGTSYDKGSPPETMKKPFLLLAGHMESPESSTEEWVRCYETEEAAEAAVTKVQEHGKDLYEVDNQQYAWYDIIDLRHWAE